jgi:hypothetical protein
MDSYINVRISRNHNRYYNRKNNEIFIIWIKNINKCHPSNQYVEIIKKNRHRFRICRLNKHIMLNITDKKLL